MARSFLLYGATGYTGTLIARAAVARGLAPVLAGRSAETLARLAGELGLAHRAFGLDAPEQIDAGISGLPVALHCAGPFRETSAPMAAACLRTQTHYLDITGEVGVFEALAAKDVAAKAAGVMLLPGVGFDVVPTDCLAAHLKRRLPTATHLALAIGGMSGVSRGTAVTAVGGTGYGSGGLVRAGGILQEVPLSYKARRIDLGDGTVTARTIPWGDVSTAYHTTGIPNIEVYMAGAPGGLASGLLGAVMGSHTGRRILQSIIRRTMHGPSDEARARGHSLVWGEATDDAGRRAVSRLRTPEAYSLTVDTALAIVERVLAGDCAPGFQTPAGAYGPDLILSIPGVTRTDEEIQ
jgi:short subunit dehydrogenase-like uncharacterized protein